MATKTFGEEGKSKSVAKRSEVGNGDNAPFRGYINLSLSDAEKDAYDEWATPAVVFGVFDRAVASGVNVATKPDPKGQGILASATQRREASVNAGLCVTARARDPVTAFGRLMYMLSVLERSESWEDTQPLANPDRWS